MKSQLYVHTCTSLQIVFEAPVEAPGKPDGAGLRWPSHVEQCQRRDTSP
jgi:hypothetical protein